MSSSDDDSQQRFALGFIFALIALIVSAVVGTVVVQRMRASAPAAPAPAATAANAPAAAVATFGPTATPAALPADAASVQVDGGVVKFYFASGQAELAAAASEALADVVKGVAQGKTAVVSGFHDTTGDAALNAELAKQRAVAVRDRLVALGVAADKVELKKPEETQAGGTNAEARRVEVVLAP